METERVQYLVVGAGPAGLMAAGELAAQGQVVLCDAMPTPARKFLMAGKSGLNLTKDEPLEAFQEAFGGSCADLVRAAVSDFGPAEVQAWAEALGQEVFTGSSGRVFPKAMKASPLLRAWMRELAPVELRARWRWTGFEGEALAFDTPNGARTIMAERVVLALGGVSWSRLGSTGAWADMLRDKGVKLTPFAPDNVGLSVSWSEHMAKHFGTPVKAVRLIAGDTEVRGEFVISARGLEGSAIYAVNRALRDGANLALDLTPDLSLDDLRARLSRPRGKASLANHLRKVARLDPARMALLNEFGRPLPGDLAPLIKHLPIRHDGPRALDEAISTAGGIAAEALDGYQLRALPHVYVAGEMLDWEAPTGGYLITGCLATGRAAALAALSH